MDFNKNIKEIEAKIGYTFKDKSLLKQAFTRTSYCNENKVKSGNGAQSNEVLEFFGDSLLSSAIVTLLMQSKAKRYEFGIKTELKEGDFSNIRSKLSDKTNLSRTVEKLGLQRYFLMGEGDAKLGIANEPSVMEDLFESIIGAIYIDSGNDIKAVIAVVSKLLDVGEYLAKKSPTLQSSKNALQEWCADKKHKREAPVYKTLSERGPDHKKIYERACYIGDKIYGVGEGKNQKIADMMAAEKALEALTEEYKNQAKAQKSAPSLDTAVARLKEYAAKNKKLSPEFHDLGETDRSKATAREYKIECRIAGISVSATAPDKKTAKAKSAEMALKLLAKEAKPKEVSKPKKRQNKPTRVKK